MDPGKDRTFGQILETNSRRIMAVARSYAAADERQDLYQEILLQIWRSLDDFEGRSALDSWVYRIALNTAITFRRKTSTRARHESVADTVDTPSTRGSGDSPEREMQMLDEFIHTLDRVDRAVFLLYLEDLTYRQMAEITGLSENHVGVRINRIKKAFINRYLGG